MRIVSSYRGTERVFETPKSEVLFGRPDDKEHIDLDLSPDLKVSRRHGRIWEENGQFWIEDLNSSRGTLLSAVEIKGQGKRELKVGDVIQAGQTTLCVEALETRAPTNQTSYLETGTSLDRKSTRLNSSHLVISYAVFCLKKKKKAEQQ